MIGTPTGDTNAHHHTPHESRTPPLESRVADLASLGAELSHHQKASCALWRAADTTLRRLNIFLRGGCSHRDDEPATAGVSIRYMQSMALCRNAKIVDLCSADRSGPSDLSPLAAWIAHESPGHVIRGSLRWRRTRAKDRQGS